MPGMQIFAAGPQPRKFGFEIDDVRLPAREP